MTCNFNFQSHLQSGVGVTSKLMFVSHLSLSGIDLLAMNEGKSMASFGLSSTDSLTAGSMESVKPREQQQLTVSPSRVTFNMPTEPPTKRARTMANTVPVESIVQGDCSKAMIIGWVLSLTMFLSLYVLNCSLFWLTPSLCKYWNNGHESQESCTV